MILSFNEREALRRNGGKVRFKEKPAPPPHENGSVPPALRPANRFSLPGFFRCNPFVPEEKPEISHFHQAKKIQFFLKLPKLFLFPQNNRVSLKIRLFWIINQTKAHFPTTFSCY
jgi:hypothetical protein